MRTPKHRGTADLPGNPSSRASLLGEASQEKNVRYGEGKAGNDRAGKLNMPHTRGKAQYS